MITRTIVSSVIALASGLAVHAAPVVSDVTMAQDPGTARVTVKYRLSGEPGVITLDIQTNYVENAETKWASIGPANMCGFGGDVHQVVQPTGEGEYRTIYWNPETYWPGSPKTAGTTRAVVTAWATNAPPDIMIVHLMSPYDITYYPYKEMVPGGITNIMYKGEYMAFRKIPAKGVVWTAGLPTNHANYHASSYPHRVMLTDDYYMGVFELTVAQYNAICGSAPGSDHLPHATSYKAARGVSEGLQWPTYTDGTFDFETSHAVDSTSTLGKLRALSGGLLFDLPTEHQWEYACRAGSPGTVYTDTTPTLSFSPSDVAAVETASRIMRYAGNNTEADCEGIVTSNGKATVGSYEPNAWGLYDMLCNNSELCLGWYADWDVLYPDDAKVYVDPAGSVRDDNTYVIYRGYGFSSTMGDSSYGISIAGRRGNARDYKGSNIGQVNGWRICLTLH